MFLPDARLEDLGDSPRQGLDRYRTSQRAIHMHFAEAVAAVNRDWRRRWMRAALRAPGNMYEIAGLEQRTRGVRDLRSDGARRDLTRGADRRARAGDHFAARIVRAHDEAEPLRIGGEPPRIGRRYACEEQRTTGRGSHAVGAGRSGSVDQIGERFGLRMAERQTNPERHGTGSKRMDADRFGGGANRRPRFVDHEVGRRRLEDTDSF